MAPIGTVDMLGWFSSPEVGIISLVVFLILSITLVGLCARCHRNSGNAYDVNGTTPKELELEQIPVGIAVIDRTDGVNGTTKTGGSGDAGTVNWRNHADMPPSTLERPHAATH